MILREFNKAGIEECRLLLEALRSGTITSVPRAFLEDSALSTPKSTRELVSPPRIKNRWELGIWLWRDLEGKVPEAALLGSDGFWTWMAFWLFDLIAPPVDGVRKIGEDSRVILDRANRRRWYRHLLAGPYLLVKTHSDNPSRLRAVLSGAPETPGELYEQIAGRKGIVTLGSVVEVFTMLYWNEIRLSFKRGAAGRGAGCANRYGMLLEQFDVTYDLEATPADKLFSMMPREFDRFKS